METEKHIEIFGDPVDLKALEQIRNCLLNERATAGALMADHHLGYSMPIGGVVAYKDAVSPSGVGFDIGCGNKAVRTNIRLADLLPDWLPEGTYPPELVRKAIRPIMEAIKGTVSFGVGRKNQEKVDHSLFDDPFWTEITRFSPHLKEKARDQLGTVGGGNHYVDLLVDEAGYIWVANHFGSRGLGHTIATGYMNLDRSPALKDKVDIRRAFGNKLKESEEPCVLSTDTELGQSYLEAMRLAGDYAYAGRDFVIDKVLSILGAEYDWHVHNHHNFAWLEDGEWVVRKGATPLSNEFAFIGGSMGDKSVIVRGSTLTDRFPGMYEHTTAVLDIGALRSAPHGAGRVMSRTAAAGKRRKMWYCGNQNCSQQPVRAEWGTSESPYPGGKCPKCGIPIRKGPFRDTSTAAINWKEVSSDLFDRGITVLGANAEEAPGVYKDLGSVLAHHPNIEVVWELQPIGVVMADADEIDPWKD